MNIEHWARAKRHFPHMSAFVMYIHNRLKVIKSDVWKILWTVHTKTVCRNIYRPNSEPRQHSFAWAHNRSKSLWQQHLSLSLAFVLLLQRRNFKLFYISIFIVDRCYSNDLKRNLSVQWYVVRWKLRSASVRVISYLLRSTMLQSWNDVHIYAIYQCRK